MSSKNTQAPSVISHAVLRILRRLARLLLRHGVPFDAFVELAKRAYVDTAMNDFALPGRKPSASRAAVLTGLTRKEVQRLSTQAADPESPVPAFYNRASRVVAGWVRDREFSDANAAPRALPFDGKASFSELVRRYSGDVPPRAVLDELLRVGMAERRDDGRIHLLNRSFVPQGEDPAALRILGADVALLVDTIDHNLQHADAPRFQRKVIYDNLSVEAMEAVRALCRRQSQALIEQLDTQLAAHDRDANPTARGSGRVCAGVGIYYFENESDSKGGRK